jgi:hypothetical protein
MIGGDISYAMGYMAVWDFFLNMISPISSKVLYLTTVGNHESDYPNSGNQHHIHPLILFSLYFFVFGNLPSFVICHTSHPISLNLIF